MTTAGNAVLQPELSSTAAAGTISTGYKTNRLSPRQVVFEASPAAKQLPNIIMHMTDDQGYYHVGFNSERTDKPSRDVKGVTPHATELAMKDGIVLTRHYVHWHCSPSRRAFLTGRLPIHMGEALSPEDEDHIDLRWKTIGHKLESAGYASYWFGKGHTGFKSMRHLPIHAGFSAGSVGFLGANMYHGSTSVRWQGDDWFIPHNLSARETHLYESRLSSDIKYSTRHWSLEALRALRKHDTRTPVFMFMAWQEPHRPYEAPPGWNAKTQSCDGMETDHSSVSIAKRSDACSMFTMLGFMDEQMAQMTAVLKERGMWANTLMVIASDNGGVDAGVNYPLRGEKHTNFEGGIRGAAAVTGGLVPEQLRGTINSKVFSIVDWYPTFCHLAGVDPSDDPPVAPSEALRGSSGYDSGIYGQSSYPGIDGVNIWPHLSSADAKEHSSDEAHEELVVTSEVLVAGRYKLVTAMPDPDLMKEKHVELGWRSPDGSWEEADAAKWSCSTFEDRRVFRPCLFDIEEDEREKVDLSSKFPQLTMKLWKRLNETLRTRYATRSPPELLGTCDTSCAAKHFAQPAAKKHLRHPVCGVPGCS